MMGSLIRFKRGNKADLPQSAPSGTPLWCEDKKELYVGTGTGVAKINADFAIPVVQQPSSGTINLVDNAINRLSPTGKIKFVTPTVTDDTIFHKIIAQVYCDISQEFDYGTYNYYNRTKPDKYLFGWWDVIYEYNGRDWSVEVKKRGYATNEGIGGGYDDLDDLFG